MELLYMGYMVVDVNADEGSWNRRSRIPYTLLFVEWYSSWKGDGILAKKTANFDFSVT
jgi:hypothetical protein